MATEKFSAVQSAMAATVSTPITTLRSPGVTRLLATSLVARFPAAAMGVLFVLQARHLGLSYAAGGATAAAFAIGTAGGAPLLGRMIDRRGQTGVLTLSAIVCTLALVGAAALQHGAALA